MLHWMLTNGSAMLVLILAVHWFGRRRLGKLGLIDLVMINTIGDLASHTAYETEHTLWHGLGSLVLWLAAGSGLGYLAGRWPWFRRFYYGGADELVTGGVLHQQRLDQLGIAMEELQSELRKQGVDDVTKPRSVWLEPDGSFSVIKADTTAQELRRLAGALSALAGQLEQQETPSGR